MKKTSRPLKIKTNEDGKDYFSFNTTKPTQITMLSNGKYEISVANAIIEVDTSGEQLCMIAKKIPKSIDGLDSGDIYCEQDGSVMVVD